MSHGSRTEAFDWEFIRANGKTIWRGLIDISCFIWFKKKTRVVRIGIIIRIERGYNGNTYKTYHKNSAYNSVFGSHYGGCGFAESYHAFERYYDKIRKLIVNIYASKRWSLMMLDKSIKFHQHSIIICDCTIFTSFQYLLEEENENHKIIIFIIIIRHRVLIATWHAV